MNPMGGFARRMSFWNAFARKYPERFSLRLDGGSIFDSGSAQASLVNRWILEGTLRSNLGALNLSAWDLPVWRLMADLTAAGQLSKELLNIALVSANVKAKVTSFPQVQRYVIKEFGLDSNAGSKSFRIGITGLLFDPQERISRQDFEILDYQQAAREVMAEIAGRTDYRVVLTDMDLGKAISLAIQVPGINLILVAHNYEAASEPQQVGDTLIVTSVNEGRAISEVRLNVGKAGKVDSRNRLVPLDKTVPDDPILGELVRKAQAQLHELRKAVGSKQ
jgi:2',3'-cyclic-nucleotide 2'-phosphodiesterase (5'-nucleotidase family)